MQADICSNVTLYYRSPCEGYGPLENGSGNFFAGIIRYGKSPAGAPLGQP
jgi:hypothetical protein